MKLLGITQRIVETVEYEETRDALSHDWLKFFKQIGINFVVLPNDPELALELVKGLSINGIVLTGGNDIPLLDDGRLNHSLLSVRDQTEITLIDYCCKLDIPVLGVCRGAQLINLHFGGTLKQVQPICHVNINHEIKLCRKEIYSDLNEPRATFVNSYHNYAIDVTSKKFAAWAVANDMCVEAIKHNNMPIWGIMWHPERPLSTDKGEGFDNEKLFKQIFGI